MKSYEFTRMYFDSGFNCISLSLKKYSRYIALVHQPMLQKTLVFYYFFCLWMPDHN